MKAIIARVADEPAALVELVDARIGLSLARVVDCEREDEVDVVRHLCGSDAEKSLRALHEELANRVHALVDYPEKLKCTTTPAAQCRIDVGIECEPVFTLTFAGTREAPRLVTLIERDDWQAPEESREELDRRIAELIGSKGGCP